MRYTYLIALYICIFQSSYILSKTYRATHNSCVCDTIDIFHNFNSKSFNIHCKIDKVLLLPISKLYDKIPKIFKKYINNINKNLEFILFKGLNAILQKDLKGFIIESRKFIINSTIGCGGILDIAKKFKKKYTKNHQSDIYTLAHTLGKYGLKHKYYIFLPFIGPVSLLTLIDLITTTKINKAIKTLNTIYNIHNSIDKRLSLEQSMNKSKKLLLNQYTFYKSAFTAVIKSTCIRCS